MWRAFDIKVAKEICYGCNSPVSKAAYNYFRTAMFRTPDKVWAELYSRLSTSRRERETMCASLR